MMVTLSNDGSDWYDLTEGRFAELRKENPDWNPTIMLRDPDSAFVMRLSEVYALAEKERFREDETCLGLPITR